MRPLSFFTADSVLYEDDDLVFVNKPSGMPSQSADPSYPDDVAHRLTRFLETRDGSAPRLGVHQRLDRDTSGVMVFAKTERANRSLSRQFESRTLRKEYVAGVRNYAGGARTLEHALGELDRGRVQVLHAQDPRAKPAVSDVVVIEREADRTLLGVTLHTGRTHQIRVQLAAIDAPLAGDRLYGRDAAPRMMLHASTLELEKPSDGRKLVVRAKVPAVFRRWLAGEDAAPLSEPAALRAALRRAIVARAGLFEARLDARATDMFRLLHAEADGVRSLAVDVYGDHLVAHLYDDLDAETERLVLDELGSLGFEGVYVKRRPMNASRVVDPTRAEIAPSRAVRGTSAPESLVLRERGVRYHVRLGDGLSTGIFLDQRENRARVREVAKDALVLNLFAYTCAFSAAAAAGGAREVVSVDAALPALEIGVANFALGAYAAAHRVARDDVFEFLRAIGATDQRFDLIVCDPPTYSTTKHGRWASGADWAKLVGAVLGVAAETATIFFCSNDRRMAERVFRQRVTSALAAAGRRGSVRSFDPPSDFPAVAGADATMKTVRVLLSR